MARDDLLARVVEAARDDAISVVLSSHVQPRLSEAMRGGSSAAGHFGMAAGPFPWTLRS